MSSSLRITDIKAYPTSFPVAVEDRVSPGIGQSVKRDTVVVNDGCVRQLEGNGLGLKVNEEFLHQHPVIEGPGYV